jgi:hypothetical protein
MPARDEALAELARRYFTSRGPATVQDFAKWSGLTMADARQGLEAVRAALRHEVHDGRTFWGPQDGPGATWSSPAAHLLSICDEYISGYKDRSAIITEEHAARLAALGSALSYFIAVDGKVAGTWRRTINRTAVTIEANLFRRLEATEAQAVTEAAQQYGRFLNLPVALLPRLDVA